MTKKIGLYGGTFDPIHCAHLILAREALEQLELERVIFIPAAQSPHKLAQVATDGAVRLEMLRAAVANEPRFAIDDLELRRPPPSYAMETVEELKRRDPRAEFFYLIGSDQLPKLQTWHRAEELRALVQFVVLERVQTPAVSEFRTIHRVLEISSTEIRKRVAAGLTIRYFVPPAVEEIIARHQLYRNPEKSLPKN